MLADEAGADTEEAAAVGEKRARPGCGSEEEAASAAQLLSTSPYRPRPHAERDHWRNAIFLLPSDTPPLAPGCAVRAASTDDTGIQLRCTHTYAGRAVVLLRRRVRNYPQAVETAAAEMAATVKTAAAD